MPEWHLMRRIAVTPRRALGPRVRGVDQLSRTTVNFYDNFFNFSKLILTLNFNFCAGDQTLTSKN